MLSLTILIVSLTLIAVLLFTWQSKKRPAAAGIPTPTTTSARGTCARCGEERIIINSDARLCAFCWSTAGTKQSG